MTACTLTIREAFERYYDTSELSPACLGKMKCEILRWEKLTGDPPVSEITNASVADFRAAAIESGYRPATINSGWGTLRSILRRLGPPMTGNPWGLSLIPAVPAMRPVRVIRHVPCRVPLDDISRVYVACRHAQFPRRSGFPAPDWWRALIVIAYCTGLRKSDLLRLEKQQFDFDNLTVNFTSHKTGKSDVFPLHPAAAEHVLRILPPHRERVFYGMSPIGSRFYIHWHEIIDRSGIKRRFGLQDIRRTAASEVDRVDRGLGKVFLQHASRDVSEMFYLNATDELTEAISKLRLPIGFVAGPKMQARAEREQRKHRIAPAEFLTPGPPDRSEWKWPRHPRPTSFCFRGRWYSISPKGGVILKLLAKVGGPVRRSRLIRALYGGEGGISIRNERVQAMVAGEVSRVRKKLRRCLGLSDAWDPIPCTRGTSTYTLCIPPDVGWADD